MPWENTENHIRSGHRDPDEFQKDTLKTITFDEKEGVKAVEGSRKAKTPRKSRAICSKKAEAGAGKRENGHYLLQIHKT